MVTFFEKINTFTDIIHGLLLNANVLWFISIHFIRTTW